MTLPSEELTVFPDFKAVGIHQEEKAKRGMPGRDHHQRKGPKTVVCCVVDVVCLFLKWWM